MNELPQFLHVLGLKPGATREEVKKAYRELLMVWHPDRFPAGSELQAKADDKTRQLNDAYEFVMAHGFQADGTPIVPEELVTGVRSPMTEVQDSAEVEEPERGAGKMAWLWVALLVAGLAGGWFWWRSGQGTAQSASPVPAGLNEEAVSNTPETATQTGPAIKKETVANDLIPTLPGTNNQMAELRAIRGCLIQQVPEGMLLTIDGSARLRQEISPPFIIRAIAKTDLTNIRLHYGSGFVIFNWELNPNELRYHDPATGQAHAVAGKGQVTPNRWVNLEWRIETNQTIIRVDGAERARFGGNFMGLKELPGIGPAVNSKVTLKYFEAEPLAPLPVERSIDLKSGLVLYYPCDGVENGTVMDQSGFKNHGKAQGTQFIPEGRVGGALRFKGNAEGGDRVITPHTPSLVFMQTTRQLTICAWIKPYSTPHEYPMLVAKGGGNRPKITGGYELVLHANKQNDLVFQSGGYGVSTYMAGGSWINKHLNEWIHVALVINSATGTRKYFINGERTGDEADNADVRRLNFLSQHPLVIGAPDAIHDPNRAGFDGLLDEFRIYARALTVEEIRHLPGLPTTSATPTTVGK